MARAEPQARPAALERHALRCRLDRHLHRHRREDHRRHGREQCQRRTDREPTPGHPARGRLRLRRTRTKGDGLDAFVLGRPESAHRGRRIRFGRCRGIARRAGQHLEHATTVLVAQLEAAATDVEHVPGPQPHGTRDRRAVVQDFACVTRGLHEQLAVVQADPRRRPRRRRQRQVRPRATDRHREVAGDEQAFAERFAQDQFDAQIGSSQRITTEGASRPGTRVISRRTSR